MIYISNQTFQVFRSSEDLPDDCSISISRSSPRRLSQSSIERSYILSGLFIGSGCCDCNWELGIPLSIVPGSTFHNAQVAQLAIKSQEADVGISQLYVMLNSLTKIQEATMTFVSTASWKGVPQPKSTSLTVTSKTNAVKYKPSFYKKADAENEAKIQALQNLGEYDQTDILSRVIQYEREIGCAPTILDLLCRFTRKEIHSIWNELIWLYPELDSKESTDIRSVDFLAQKPQVMTA